VIKEKRSIGFVCLANYCRSPVAKILFKKKFGHSFKADSAGINPMVSAGMDQRSIDFLKENNAALEIHNPKKVDRNFFNSSSIVFAMDTFVLMELNKNFKNYRDKIKLFTYQHKNLNLMDPFKLSDEKYKEVMNNIEFVIDSLILDEIF